MSQQGLFFTDYIEAHFSNRASSKRDSLNQQRIFLNIIINLLNHQRNFLNEAHSSRNLLSQPKNFYSRVLFRWNLFG